MEFTGAFNNVAGPPIHTASRIQSFTGSLTTLARPEVTKFKRNRGKVIKVGNSCKRSAAQEERSAGIKVIPVQAKKPTIRKF